MGLYYFDEQGEHRDVRLDPRLDDLRKCVPKDRWATYIATNSGFATATITSIGIHIRCRLDRVHELSYYGMIRWLCDRRATRVILHLFDNKHWRTVLCTGTATSVTEQLRSRYRGSTGMRQDKVLHKARPLGTIRASSPLRQILRYWVDTAGRYDPNTFDDVANTALNGRYAVFRNKRDSSILEVQACGAGMPDCAKAWLIASVGRGLHEQPDSDYAEYCANAYLRAVRGAAPLFDDVDAIVAWPGFGSERRRYRRLILPFDDIDGSSYLLSASFTDNSIDLRPS